MGAGGDAGARYATLAAVLAASSGPFPPRPVDFSQEFKSNVKNNRYDLPGDRKGKRGGAECIVDAVHGSLLGSVWAT